MRGLIVGMALAVALAEAHAQSGEPALHLPPARSGGALRHSRGDPSSLLDCEGHTGWRPPPDWQLARVNDGIVAWNRDHTAVLLRELVPPGNLAVAREAARQMVKGQVAFDPPVTEKRTRWWTITTLRGRASVGGQSVQVVIEQHARGHRRDLVWVAVALGQARHSQLSLMARARASNLPLVADGCECGDDCRTGAQKQHPGSASAPVVRGQIAVEPHGLLLDGQAVSCPGPRGFASSPFVAPGKPDLRQRARALGHTRVAIRFSSMKHSKVPWTALDLWTLLTEVEAVPVLGWELQVGSRRCGSFAVLPRQEHAEIEANDLRLREEVKGHARRINTSGLRPRKAAAPRRIDLTVDFGTPLSKLCTLLGAVDGDQIRLGIHAGPY